MTTPSKHEKAYATASAFNEFMITTMKMIHFIDKMKAVMDLSSIEDEPTKKMIMSIAEHQEKAFKHALTPFMERLMMLETAIKKNIPTESGKIITPDDPEFN